MLICAGTCWYAAPVAKSTARNAVGKMTPPAMAPVISGEKSRPWSVWAIAAPAAALCNGTATHGFELDDFIEIANELGQFDQRRSDGIEIRRLAVAIRR